ncbi:hypothetical protein EYB53_012845 [Candidatus Chloroploca sp. M-50]|uniref:Uncharacterized protein n=1 Tax=Candidatus Chloroploca mongolica TaxID=2528176 RepID=A0ABS4DAX3_9CHLR|nr:hypothetical protein [Candidatus Chloroploca mongolica]MBP1466596.1 hypothetical protein [Candidatus Chloroploca mongolica]
MYVQTTITHSLEAVLRELDQPALPDKDGIIVSTMHDKFFKGGGCEHHRLAEDGTIENEPAVTNIAVCMHA